MRPVISDPVHGIVTGIKALPEAKRRAVFAYLYRHFTQSGLRDEAEAAHTLSLSGRPERAKRESVPEKGRVHSLQRYLADHECSAVLSWRHAQNIVDSKLSPAALLQAVLDQRAPVQVAYLNSPEFARPDTFPLLLCFLALSGVWAVNLGEVEFSDGQCEQLERAIARGGVGFLFVDAVHVGDRNVRLLKRSIKKNRQRQSIAADEPWLLSPSPFLRLLPEATLQNEVCAVDRSQRCGVNRNIMCTPTPCLCCRPEPVLRATLRCYVHTIQYHTVLYRVIPYRTVKIPYHVVSYRIIP